MRSLLLTLFLTLSALLACGDLISHTYIEVGKQFVLGGQQRGAFRVKVRNSGSVPVSVAECFAGGRTEERERLEPGTCGDLRFAAGSAALVRNLGSQTAELDVDIIGDVSSMGMDYRGLPK